MPPFDYYYRTRSANYGRRADRPAARRQHILPGALSPADFVTTDSGTGVVHQAPAFGEVDFDVLRHEQARFAPGKGPRVDLRRRPRRQIHGRSARLSRPLGQRWRQRHLARAAASRAALSSRAISARIPVLLAGRRRSADPISAQELVHPHDRSSKRRCSPTTSRSTGCPSTSRTAASATSWRRTSIGPCRASATGARRCRSGFATRRDQHRKPSASYDELLAKPGVRGTEVWDEGKTDESRACRRSESPQALHRRRHIRRAPDVRRHACGACPK